jgi:hypothetical protein
LSLRFLEGQACLSEVEGAKIFMSTEHILCSQFATLQRNQLQ